jgi:hypothetical protein
MVLNLVGFNLSKVRLGENDVDHIRHRVVKEVGIPHANRYTYDLCVLHIQASRSIYVHI